MTHVLCTRVRLRVNVYQVTDLNTMYAFAETQTYADDYGGPAWSRKRKWHFNQQWIRSCYGKAYLQELWNVHSTCAGCLMGGMPALLQYLQI